LKDYNKYLNPEELFLLVIVGMRESPSTVSSVNTLVLIADTVLMKSIHVLVHVQG
jgi:hypothetical protein